MNSYQTILAVLRVWTLIPEDLHPQLLNLLYSFLNAEDEVTRANIALEIEILLESVPESASAYDNVSAVIDAERGLIPSNDSDLSRPALPISLAEVQSQVEKHLIAEDDRVINTWIEGLSSDEPLDVKQIYDLMFDVGLPHKDTRAPITHFPSDAIPVGREYVDVLVILDTDDFTIHGDTQAKLVVPRFGKSENIVCFRIEPKKDGPGVVKALFITNERGLFQRMTLTFQVGTIAAYRSSHAIEGRGLTLSSSLARVTRQQGRKISVTILKCNQGYQFIVRNGGVTRAFLKLSVTQIAELVAQTREVFKEIVYRRVNNKYIYQLDDTTIPPQIHAATLKTMAKHGALMYRKLFYGPGSGPDARAMGDLLRKLSRDHQLHIQIVAEHFTFPWSMLYARDDLKPDLSNIDPEGFWGFKPHNMTHICSRSP